MRRWITFALLIFTASRTFAQVTASIESDQSNFLLYAPVLVRVLVQNNTEQDVLLQNTADITWLSFIVTRPDGFPVRPDQKFMPDSLMIKAGETKAVTANLTPYYAFREPGNYKAQAVVDLPGKGQMLSGHLQFNVARGRTVWTKTRAIAGSERTFTLLRFSPDNTSTELYLRVDDAKENIVYTTITLGQIIAMVDPQTNFDAEGNLHILHTAGVGVYLYSRVNQDGTLQNQSRYQSLPEMAPSLAQGSNGSIMVVGGQIESDETRRERLSDATFGLAANKDAKKSAATTPASTAPKAQK